MDRPIRIAVPPGVGDVYWCLTKLASFKRTHGIEHVELCVQKTNLPRALDWAKLCPLVTSSCEVKIKTTTALRTGFARDVRGTDFVLWPNAIVDAGKHLRTWIPGLEYDDRVKIITEVTRPAGDVVVFPAHEGINQIWLAKQPPEFWERIIAGLERRFEKRVTIIGSWWDKSHCDRLSHLGEYLVAQTSLAQVAAILERASVVVGVASGMTILANRFRTPTVAFFPRKHHPLFPWTWVPDDAPYKVVWNDELNDVEGICDAAILLTKVGTWLNQHSSASSSDSSAVPA